jgi:hypothetical protein
MDYEYGREGCIFILDIKGDSFTVELLKKRVPRVVDKDELANLFTVNTWSESKTNQSHVWKETDEECICIKLAMMGFTHKHAIAQFMTGCSFGLPRDPTVAFELVPLCLTLASGELEYRFDLQYQSLIP